MEETLSLRIQARIEELQGGEEFEQKLAQRIETTMQQINRASENFTQEATTLSQNLPESQRKIISSLQSTVRAVTEELLDRFQQEIEEFEQHTDIYGLGGRQVTKWRGRFHRLGSQLVQEEMNLISDIFRERRRGADPETQEMLDVLEVQVKESLQNISNMFKQFGDGIKEYARDVQRESDNLFQLLQKGGYIGIAQMLTNQIFNIARSEELISARQQTAFNLTSPQAQYFETTQAALFEDVTRNTMLAGGVGAVAGGIIGTMLGGALGGLAGVGIGQTIGNQIAELININTRAAVERELKFLQQGYGEVNTMFQRARGYEVPATQLSARFGENIRGIEDLGYTPEQELMFKSQFGEALRRFDEELYRQQLIFTRATGLNFSDIAAINSLTRLTGQEFDLRRLDEIKNFTQGIFGENADLKRIADILTNIRDISLKQLDRSIQADERVAERMLTIPSLLFGVENPYGRIGDLGAKTLQILEGLMLPQSLSHEAFLFQALGGGGIREFNERMKAGIYDPANFRDILNFAAISSEGDNNRAYWLLNAMLKGAPRGFIDPLATLISGGEIEIERVKGQREKIDLAKFEQYFEEGIKQTGKTADELLNEWLGTARKNITQFEDAETKIANIQIEIGNKYKELIADSQRRMAEIEEKWLSSATAMSKISDLIYQGMQLIEDKLVEFGIEIKTPEKLQEEATKLKYDEVYRMNGGQPALEGESLEDYMKRTLQPITEKTTSWTGRTITKVYTVEEQIKDLQDKFAKIDQDYNNRLINSQLDNKQENFDLGKEFRKQKQSALNRELSELGYRAEEISGFRTLEDQERLRKEGKPVSDRSWHLVGRAFDVQLYDNKGNKITNEMITEDIKKNQGKKYGKLLKKLEDYAKENNLFWGGNFKDEKLRNQEWNHFQDLTWTKQQQDLMLSRIYEKQKSKTNKVKVPEISLKDNKIQDTKVDQEIKLYRELKQPKADKIKAEQDKAPSLSPQNIKTETESKPLSMLDDRKHWDDFLRNLERIVLASSNNQKQPIEVTVKFVDVPVPMLDMFQNAIVGVS